MVVDIVALFFELILDIAQLIQDDINHTRGRKIYGVGEINDHQDLQSG